MLPDETIVYVNCSSVKFAKKKRRTGLRYWGVIVTTEEYERLKNCEAMTLSTIKAEEEEIP